jgi:hypothetical protein
LRKALSFCQQTEKAVNPIGGTFLSRQDIEKLRTIAKVCISFSFS